MISRIDILVTRLSVYTHHETTLTRNLDNRGSALTCSHEQGSIAQREMAATEKHSQIGRRVSSRSSLVALVGASPISETSVTYYGTRCTRSVAEITELLENNEARAFYREKGLILFEVNSCRGDTTIFTASRCVNLNGGVFFCGIPSRMLAAHFRVP
jgi:hypothetical protein